MYTVRGTKKILDRVGRAVTDPPPSSTTLGDWYANALLWRPQVAIFVNATTFLPVLMPLAPSARVLARFPLAMAEVVHALGIDPRFVVAELNEMHEVTLARTASRQVLGVMIEFTFMAEHFRTSHVSLEGLARFLLRAESVASSKIEGLEAGRRLLPDAEVALADAIVAYDGRVQRPAETTLRVGWVPDCPAIRRPGPGVSGVATPA